ncbi:MAG TPA: hypothetical protein VJP77_07795 [Planctomycetota bacterium]|nr:hypothetical protein [Planctomycetota bacterium]
MTDGNVIEQAGRANEVVSYRLHKVEEKVDRVLANIEGLALLHYKIESLEKSRTRIYAILTSISLLVIARLIQLIVVEG